VVVVLEVVLVVVEVGDAGAGVIVLVDGVADVSELVSVLGWAWAAAAISMEEITIASAFLRIQIPSLGRNLCDRGFAELFHGLRVCLWRQTAPAAEARNLFQTMHDFRTL
jgi:hypothetical protein